MSTENKNFIEKYYNEFGVNCPFKRTGMVSDRKELVKEFEPKLEPDFALLEKFFEATIEQLLQKDYFTTDEINKLEDLNLYWDIPKIYFFILYREEFTEYSIMEYAAKHGCLYVVKWLKDSGCKWDEYTLAAAAECGNLETMEWLHQNGCPSYPDTFTAAAGYGSLKNMKWLLENKFEWEPETFTAAVANGNLENMKWLKKHGCPWEKETCMAAMRKGDITNIKWLLDNNIVSLLTED